jgi:hypothetical protein
MEINVEVRGVDQVVDRLSSLPGAATWVLKMAILKSLRGGRAAAQRFARERYNVAPAYLKQAVGQPRLSGISGFLRIVGNKIPLAAFPHKDVFPRGAEISELKNAPVIALRHAFAKTAFNQVYERPVKGQRGLPILRMAGLSVPQMVGERKENWPKLQENLETTAILEIQRLTRLILSGEIRARSGATAQSE